MSAGRGGGWVVAQFVLMGAVAVAGLLGPRWPDGARTALTAAGALFVLSGAALAVRAARALGRALTPFPRPAAGGSLVEHGGYGVVRHPIYTGGILFCAGFSLWAGPAALALTAVLTILWGLKAGVEERYLAARYPAYGDYCRRVRWRLVPYVY